MNRVNGIIFWIIIYTMISIVFDKFLSEKLGENNLLKTLFYKPDEKITCMVEYDACGDDVIDGQCLMFATVSFVIGYYYPNKVLLFLITILTGEFAKQLLDVDPRFIINPLVALTGYMIGSWLSPKNTNLYKIQKYELEEDSNDC